MPTGTQPSTESAWPEGVIARYLTKAAEITGDQGLTVDFAETETDYRYSCRGCGDGFKNFWQPSVRSRAQSHAETCRAVLRPTA